MRLTTTGHERGNVGLTYVYAVVSRRARGLSIGINLNTNNACNWRCVYCQVPGLVLGKAPQVDLAALARELDEMLTAVVHGDFLARNAEPGFQRLNDIAFSGNGEPTSSPQFREAIQLAVGAKERFGVAKSVKLVLITNGSLAHDPEVQAGLAEMAGSRGEVWFKLDRATEEGQRLWNNTSAGIARTRTNLRHAAQLCPTWVQTMMCALDGAPPSEKEIEAYLAFLAEELAAKTPLRGVLLYGLARESHQPEAPRLSPLTAEWLEALARRIRALGLEVQVSP